jgi:hypothetical protein
VIRNKADTTFLSFFYIKQAASPGPDDYTPELRKEIVPKALELIYTGWDLVNFADYVWADASDPLQKAIKQQWDENVQETNGGNTDAEAPGWVETVRSSGGPHIPHLPFKYDESRRLDIKAELNAIVANIYDIEYREFEYILDTFSSVKRDQLDKYSEYRTKQLAMNYFEEYEDQSW